MHLIYFLYSLSFCLINLTYDNFVLTKLIVEFCDHDRARNASSEMGPICYLLMMPLFPPQQELIAQGKCPPVEFIHTPNKVGAPEQSPSQVFLSTNNQLSKHINTISNVVDS